MVLVRPEDYSAESPDTKFVSYKMKTPKRVLHFSDGIMEEYSTDEEDCDNSPPSEEINPSTLSWGPWIMFKTWSAGTSTLSFVDYMGETLAWLFGITTPKYYFELEEYKRRQEVKTKQAEMEKGWCDEKNQIIDVPLKTNTSAQSRIEQV